MKREELKQLIKETIISEADGDWKSDLVAINNQTKIAAEKYNECMAELQKLSYLVKSFNDHFPTYENLPEINGNILFVLQNELRQGTWRNFLENLKNLNAAGEKYKYHNFHR